MYTNYRIYYFLVSLFPLFFITGPFLPDFICSLLAIYFLFFLIREQKFYYLKNNIFYFFFILYLYLNLNSFTSFEPEISFKTSITFIRIILFIFFISYIVEKYPKILIYTYYCFLLCIFFLFIDSLLQFYFKFNIFGAKVEQSNRISSFFGDELVMGSYVARLLPCIIGLSFFANLKNKFFLNLIIIIISFLLIILSGERTALFYFSVFLVFYFIIHRKDFKFFLLFSSFFLIIFISYEPQQLKRISIHTVNQIKESKYFLSYRHELHIFVAYKMFLEKKYFGHGLKGFRNLCQNKKYNSLVDEYKQKDLIKFYDIYGPLTYDKHIKIKTISNTNACNTHPHSIYLEFLAELGMVGFLFFLIIFLFVLTKFFSYLLKIIIKKNKDSLILGKFFILLGFLTSLIPMLPSGSYFNNYMLIITYFPMGFYLYGKNKNTNV